MDPDSTPYPISRHSKSILTTMPAMIFIELIIPASPAQPDLLPQASHTRPTSRTSTTPRPYTAPSPAQPQPDNAGHQLLHASHTGQQSTAAVWRRRKSLSAPAVCRRTIRLLSVLRYPQILRRSPQAESN